MPATCGDLHRAAARALSLLLIATAVVIPVSIACVQAQVPPTATEASRQNAARSFVEVRGVLEFSGRMIARPLQASALAAAGLRLDAARVRSTALAAIGGLAGVRHVIETDEFLFSVGPGSENSVAARLMATGAFQYVEPDWICYPIGCPNDPQFGQQWHLQADRMASCVAWDSHTGNAGVGIGICDTGVLISHEDLQLNRREGYNAVDRRWEQQGGAIGPVHPHGTATTGCAAANGNNGRGVSGVGWNLAHRMLRVSNSTTGNAALSDLQHAARTSIQSGDRVASVSYSGVDAASNLTTATYIKSIGGLLVWAAGNDGRNLTLGPRDADDLIVVGATDQADVRAGFSAYGNFMDVVAPGVGVLTTDAASGTSYASVSGTSFACPLVAGLCGLIWSCNPSLSPNQVEAILKQSADDLGAAGVDPSYGYGRINAQRAMSHGASVTRFGKACRTYAGVCLPKNTQYTTATQQIRTNAWIFLRVTVPANQTLVVSGFELLLRSRSGAPVRVETALHAADAQNRPAARLHAGTSVFVDTAQQWCPTWFPPTTFGSGTVFYIAYLNPPSDVSLGATADASGAQANWFTQPPGGALRAETDIRWKYRVLCGGATPNLRVSGLPAPGVGVRVRVDNVPNGAGGWAMLWLGATNAQHGGIPLPLDLGIIGGPQCDLNIALHASLGGVWESGNVWAQTLLIPNNRAFIGANIFLQWVVGAPGSNPGGFATSEGAHLVVGGC